MAAELSVKSIHPFLQQNDTKTSSGCTIRSYSHPGPAPSSSSSPQSGPIIALVHGYPYSSYMWRHVIKPLSEQYPLFVPELPGYGISSPFPSADWDKREVGKVLMEALHRVLGRGRDVLWVGFDRGARVGHRLLAEPDPGHEIRAVVMVDIVPTLEQWRSFARTPASVGYFHWPLLARPEAAGLVGAVGGGRWCRVLMEGTMGSHAGGLRSQRADEAWEHYEAVLSREEAIRGTCDDYRFGGVPECSQQEDEQGKGKKVRVPTMVIYSATGLGKMHDVPSCWEGWVDGELVCKGIEGGHGHNLPESAPEEVVRLVKEWAMKV